MEPGNVRATAHPSEDCRPVGEILARVGDKWSVLLVMQLGSGLKRFSDLKRSMAGISQKMLTTTLRGLERDGFITRTQYPTIPPKVEYELTSLGHDLLGPVQALGAWAVTNRKAVEAARERFDARAGAEAPSASGALWARIGPPKVAAE